ATGIGAFLAFAMLVSDGRWLRLGGDVTWQHHVERSLGLLLTTVGGAVALAGTALWIGLSSGRSMLGPSRRSLLYGGVLIPVTLLAWKVGWTLRLGGAMVAWPERPGLRCLMLSLLVGVGPLLSFTAMRRSAPRHPALTGGALGLAAGAC